MNTHNVLEGQRLFFCHIHVHGFALKKIQAFQTKNVWSLQMKSHRSKMQLSVPATLSLLRSEENQREWWAETQISES